MLLKHEVVAFDEAYLVAFAVAHFASVHAMASQLNIVTIVPMPELQASGIFLYDCVASFVRLSVAKDRSAPAVKAGFVSSDLLRRRNYNLLFLLCFGATAGRWVRVLPGVILPGGLRIPLVRIRGIRLPAPLGIVLLMSPDSVPLGLIVPSIVLTLRRDMTWLQLER
jgi:hypothetical protein